MSKIKGWERFETKSGLIYYKHINGKRLLLIDNNLVELTIEGKDVTSRIILIQKEFKTKKQALDYAIKYMRLHPNG